MKKTEMCSAARTVVAAKRWAVALGIVCLILGFVMYMESMPQFAGAWMFSLALFILGGFLAGFAEVVEAAHRYIDAHPRKTEE